MIFFEIIAISFFCISCLLTGFMMIYLKRVKNKRAKYRKWKNITALLVRDAIFYEDDDIVSKDFNIPNRVLILLNQVNFRKILTKDIISAKKNLVGKSAIFVQKLYLQLGLDKYALKNLRNNSWHIKAKAIQDIGIMGLKDHLFKIYRNTNQSNELIRTEAQIAVIKMTGFEGLRFLDVIDTPLNNWQQIKLLNELSQVKTNNFSGVENWLSSTNESVIIFALKLVKNFRRLELYPRVELCLLNSCPKIRHQAIMAIEKIHTSDTSKVIIDRYAYETIENQIAILKVLQQIGEEEDISQLVSLISTVENEQKRMIVRTIAHISEAGLIQLNLLPEINEAPLSVIVKQVKGEINR